jgi:hypothetical protein
MSFMARAPDIRASTTTPASGPMPASLADAIARIEARLDALEQIPAQIEKIAHRHSALRRRVMKQRAAS